jgi:putative ABC transport system permease protein
VRANYLTLDFSLVWFGIGLALVAAVFLAYIPRLPSPNNAHGGLSARGVRSGGGSSRRLRVFAVTQITASFLLLAGACVLMKTLFVLEETRPPFQAANVMAINLPVMSYGKSEEQVRDFYREVTRRIGALPGVEHVSSGFSAPWRDDRGLNINFAFAAQGARRADGQDFRANFRSVSPGFFATFGVPIAAGRDFNDGDKDGAERVVIISQSLANQLYPGQNPVNRKLWWTDGVMKFIGISTEPRRIIAVVPDFDDENIIPSPAMTIYQPVEQEGWGGRLFVRAHQDPYALVPAISRTIHEMSNDQPVEKASTLGDVRAEVLTPDKLNAIVFGGFAAVALLISVVGVAGVLAFSVSSRTREFGIRMALGAQRRDILKDVLVDGLIMASIGVLAGVVLGFGLSEAATKYMTEIHQPGVLAFVASAFTILLAAVIAAAVPAARAANVNAVEALRAE